MVLAYRGFFRGLTHGHGNYRRLRHHAGLGERGEQQQEREYTLGAEIAIVDPRDRERQMTAKVIATSENPDLALLECEALEAPAVNFAERLPPRGEDIMCLGFPGGSLLGLALKSTKGSVISLGDDDLDGGKGVLGKIMG